MSFGSQVRIALVGDVHLAFGPKDVEAIDARDYDLALFVGDLAGYLHRGGVKVSRLIASLRTPTVVIPGNHDAAQPAQIVAEVVRNEAAIGMLAGGQRARVDELRRALSPAVLGGYSTHPLELGGLRFDLLVARPHSFGGPHLAFRPYLEEAFGVTDIASSAARLCALVDACESDRLVILAHNGPSGLGERRHDPWGCDFRKGEGDFGDPDLAEAVAHARQRGKRVVAVLAGHMHHALRGGGLRTWTTTREGTLFVNAARVPRVFRQDGAELRHHVCVTIDADGARAEEVLVAG